MFLSECEKSGTSEDGADSKREHVAGVVNLDRSGELLFFLLLFRDNWLRVDIIRLSEPPGEFVLRKPDEYSTRIVSVETTSKCCSIPTVEDALPILIVLLAICFVVDVNHGEAALCNVRIRKVLAWTQLIDSRIAHWLISVPIESILSVLIVP